MKNIMNFFNKKQPEASTPEGGQELTKDQSNETPFNIIQQSKILRATTWRHLIH